MVVAAADVPSVRQGGRAHDRAASSSHQAVKGLALIEVFGHGDLITERERKGFVVGIGDAIGGGMAGDVRLMGCFAWGRGGEQWVGRAGGFRVGRVEVSVVEQVEVYGWNVGGFGRWGAAARMMRNGLQQRNRSNYSSRWHCCSFGVVGLESGRSCEMVRTCQKGASALFRTRRHQGYWEFVVLRVKTGCLDS